MTIKVNCTRNETNYINMSRNSKELNKEIFVLL